MPSTQPEQPELQLPPIPPFPPPPTPPLPPPTQPPPGFEPQPDITTTLPFVRQQLAEHINSTATPQPTADLSLNQGVNINTEHVPAFALLEEFRAQRQRNVQLRDVEHPHQPWHALVNLHGIAASPGLPTQQPLDLFSEILQFNNQMIQHQTSADIRVISERNARRARVAERLARQYGNNESLRPVPSSTPSEHTPEDSNALICTICLERVEAGDTITTLRCQHSFHQICADTWFGITQHSSVSQPSCPQCRAEMIVISVSQYNLQPTEGEFDIFTPRQSQQGSGIVSQAPSGWATPNSQMSETLYPWWPDTYAYHSMTNLPDGRLSIIVDPGAWTNLIGANLARKLVTRALKTVTNHNSNQWNN